MKKLFIALSIFLLGAAAGGYVSYRDGKPKPEEITQEADEKLYEQPKEEDLYKIKLYIATSTDGKTFTEPEVFHQGGGVPSVTAGPDGKIVAVFQWFTEDITAENFNSVAVKISEDNGETWTNPVPIEMKNLPKDYQYPYDPTITTTEEGDYRLFFTTHVLGMGEKFVYGTALSEDGLHYMYEGVAFSTDQSVADGSAVWTGEEWYMIAPLAKQGGKATEAISTDGISFEETSGGRDSALPYVGNLVNVEGTVHFYGSAQGKMWHISTEDLKEWTDLTYLNIEGGDPGIAYTENGTYVLIYVQPQSAAL